MLPVVTTVFLSMALMASIVTFSRLEARELVHWFTFLYFVIYRIKVYLDDLQFYERVDKGIYRSRVEVYRGIETMFAVASWTLWIGVAVWLSEPKLYFLLTAANFLIALLWIGFDTKFLIDWRQDKTEPRVARIYKTWAIANFGGIVGCSMLGVAYSFAIFGSMESFLKLVGMTILAGFLAWDISSSWRFTLGFPKKEMPTNL